MKTPLFLLSFLCSVSLQAQVADDFSDGNFSHNPHWQGDSTLFSIGGGQLQLNAVGTDSAYLSTAFSIDYTQNQEWRFSLKMTFAPSSANYNRYYLISDGFSLKGIANGYYVQFGESGSADAIELFYSYNGNSTSVASGNAGSIASNVNLDIRVIRTSGGTWKIYSRPPGTFLYQQECAGQHTAQPICHSLGFKCVFTSSNSTKSSLDNVYAGAEQLDTIPPFLKSITLVDSTQLQLVFSEAIDSLTQSLQFYLSPGSTAPIQLQPDSQWTRWLVTFQVPISNNQHYCIHALQLKDYFGNMRSHDSLCFTAQFTVTAGVGDLLLTEVMADPQGGPGLPPVEYVEIYNRSNRAIHLTGLLLTDGSTVGHLSGDTLAAYHYAVLCNSNSIASLHAAGIYNCVTVSSFPTLNNDGDHIKLIGINQAIIDEMDYSLESYQDKLKNSGGWSLERIDTLLFCPEKINWRASVNPFGGTPGKHNSVYERLNDQRSFYPEYSFVIDSLTVLIHFNKYPDKNSMNDYSFEVDKGIGKSIQVVFDSIDYRNVTVRFSKPITSGQVYILTLSGQLRDCSNHTLETNSIAIGISERPNTGELLINEILFNPKGEASDYLELFNNSQKFIDLYGLKLANTSSSTLQIDEVKEISAVHRSIAPFSYLCLTENLPELLAQYQTHTELTLTTCDLPSWNDDAGDALILDATFLKIDSLHYEESMHDPQLNFKEGISLERVSYLAATNQRGNWQSAAQTVGFGTPGKVNSQHWESTDSNAVVQITPVVFSPNGDGEDDQQGISINLNQGGYKIRLRIFDRLGHLVATPADQILGGTKNIFIWDGTDDSHQTLPAGLYILATELLHPNGQTKFFKNMTVLSRSN